MPRRKDDPPVVRVYTICDESKYLIVRNVPALGCGDELLKLFATYGDVEECKPMDEEDCEQFTDVYWIKFRLVSNARFAKRKLDESVFLGNQIQVFYAPQFESVDDTKEKLEGRRKEVLARLNPGRSKGPMVKNNKYGNESSSIDRCHAPIPMVSSDQDYFGSQSMNQTVRSVREKLNKIQSNNEHLQVKKPRVDNRRRI